jgi:hypothetical protein
MSPSLDVVDSVIAVNVAMYKSAEERGDFRKCFAQIEKNPKKTPSRWKTAGRVKKRRFWLLFAGIAGSNLFHGRLNDVADDGAGLVLKIVANPEFSRHFGQFNG